MKTLIAVALTAMCLSLCASLSNAEEATAIPEEAIAAMDRLVGTWESSVTDDNGKELTRRGTCWWTRGKTALHRSAVERIDGKTVFSTCVIGWEADTHTLVEQSFLSDGRSATVRYPVDEFLGDTCEGEVSVVFGDDNRMEGKCVLEWTDTGFNWMASATGPDGTTRTRKSIVRRVEPPTEEQVLEVLKRLEGNWEIRMDQAARPATASLTAKLDPSGKVLRVVWSESDAHDAHGLIAWDEAGQRMVESWFRNGERVTVEFDAVQPDGTLFGTAEGMIAGRRFMELRSLRFLSPTEYVHTVHGTTPGGESTIRGTKRSRQPDN